MYLTTTDTTGTRPRRSSPSVRLFRAFPSTRLYDDTACVLSHIFFGNLQYGMVICESHCESGCLFCMAGNGPSLRRTQSLSYELQQFSWQNEFGLTGSLKLHAKKARQDSRKLLLVYVNWCSYPKAPALTYVYQPKTVPSLP